MYVKYIDLNEEEYFEYKNGEQIKINLAKNNIFIGKNNSGKSRLMRQLLTNEYNKEYYVNDNIEDFIELKKQLEEILIGANAYTLKLYNELYLSNEKINKKIYRNERDEEKLGIFICNVLYSDYYHDTHSKLQNKNIIKNRYAFSKDPNFGLLDNSRVKKQRINEIYNKIIEKIKVVAPDTVYFPAFLSLRKLNNIDLEQKSEYNLGISRLFANNYFDGIKGFENKIKTGQEVYNDMKKQLLSLSEEREQFLQYEKYISKNFFNDKTISVFVKDETDDIYIKEDNEEPYPIYMLGDGLQTLITITYYLFMNDDKPLKVFMDEPEIHLHPGLQRLLITELQKYKNCQFFISTHSSSLIDICDEYDDETAIVCVDKIDGKKYAYNSAYDDINLFELIGIRPSSIILSNCTIWVEGPTDIYYIDSFLKLYSKLKNKREFILGYNYNYAFNGSINIANKIDFDNNETTAMKIKKLSKKNFIIFDSDNLTEENVNFQKIKKLKSKLGNHCCVIDNLRTIENIINPQILYDFFNEKYKSRNRKIKSLILEFFEKLKDEYGTNEYYKKNIAKEMSEYINNNIEEQDADKYKKFCKNLWNSNKYNLSIYFSNKILNLSNEEQQMLFDNTMSDFIGMIEQIYKFIKQNN